MSSNVLFSWKSTLLLALLIASLMIGLNIKPVEALEITDIQHPSQVRVNENFWITVRVHYEATGPTTLTIDTIILDDETGSEEGVGSYDVDIPDGVHHDTNVGLEVGLHAPENLGPWNLRAVLTGGNEMDFSITVVGEDTPPRVSIEILEAWPDVVQIGDLVWVWGTLDYSIPEESRFEIRFTTSHGIPEIPASITEPPLEILDRIDTGQPWWIQGPEGITPPYFDEEIPRAGDMYEGQEVPLSGVGGILWPASAPIEPSDWVWHFHVVYFDPDEEEMQLGSRDLTIEVSARTEMWAVIDYVPVPIPDMPVVTSPEEEYTIMFGGRYIFPDEATHDITIEINERDSGDPICDPHSHEDITGSGSLTEYFYSVAPSEDDTSLILEARLNVDGSLVDSREFGVLVSSELVPDDIEVEILDVDYPPEVRYGDSLDIGIQVRYSLPPDIEPTLSSYVFQSGSVWFLPLAGDYVTVREGEDPRLMEISVPSAAIPPRNGPWNLEAVAAIEALDMPLYDVYPFTVDIVEAGEGVSGGSSDWMVSDAWMSPPMSIEGYGVDFWATIGVETDDSLPQQVWLTLDVDGEELLRDAVTFWHGMDYLYFRSPSPWVATPGPHTAVWTVDPDGDYMDPVLDNNQFELTFTVSEALPMLPDGELPEEEPVEEEFDFYVTADPTERTLASSISYSINVDLSSGEPEQVQLSLIGAPAGLSYSFKPSSELPPFTSTLTVTGSGNLPAATYSMMIKASDGEKERYKPIILRVEEGADYELSASPGSIKALPGEKVEYTVFVSSNSGYSRYVNLAVLGLPQGVTSRMESSAGKPDFQSILHVEVGEDVKPGVYSLIVSGSGPDPKDVSLILSVREEAPPSTTEEEEGQGRTLGYYMPLIYFVAIIAAIVAGSILAMRYVRGRPGKPKSFCIECGKKIPVGTEFCPKCGTKQKE